MSEISAIILYNGNTNFISLEGRAKMFVSIYCNDGRMVLIRDDDTSILVYPTEKDWIEFTRWALKVLGLVDERKATWTCRPTFVSPKGFRMRRKEK